MNSPLYVQELFGRLAWRYDLFNRLMSMGADGHLRKKAVEGIRPGMRILDVGTGTGELALLASQRLMGKGEVVGIDVSHEMLNLASRKAKSEGRAVRFILKRAEEVPFEDEKYDRVISGFVLRNIALHLDSILQGIFESLTPQGEIVFVDLIEPKSRFFSFLSRIYFYGVVGFWGKCLFGRDYPISYLPETMKNFLRPEELVERLKRAGFKNPRAERFCLGAIVIYSAKK